MKELVGCFGNDLLDTVGEELVGAVGWVMTVLLVPCEWWPMGEGKDGDEGRDLRDKEF